MEKGFSRPAKKKIPLIFALLLVVCTLFALSFVLMSSNITSVHANSNGTPDQLRYTSLPLHRVGSTQPLARAESASLAVGFPTWSSSFTYQNQNYPYTMVGTDPSKGSQTTNVTANIVPIAFTFSNGLSTNGSQVVSPIENSPLFTNAGFTTGNTQYVDAMQRASFWKEVSSVSPNYHLLLQPVVKPTVTLAVSASNGSATQNGSIVTGNVNLAWLGPILDTLAVQQSSAQFTIFAIVNTNGTENGVCCYGGYHTGVSDSSGNVYTYALAEATSFSDGSISDLQPFSHEMEEWANNPLVANTTPAWEVAAQPQYGCNSTLEVADPLVGNIFAINGYYVQDVAYFSWFSKSYSSLGYQGKYDYEGIFTGPSVDCNGNPPPTPIPTRTPTPTPTHTPTPTPTRTPTPAPTPTRTPTPAPTRTPTPTPTRTPTPIPTRTPTPTPTHTPTPVPTRTPTPIPTRTPTPTPISGSSCKISYTSNQWAGGFTGNIIITNTGSSTINGWTLTFTFPGSQQVTQGWNGNFSQQGNNVTVQSVNYNNSITPGSTANPGFNASWSGSNPNPTAFTLNGVKCSNA